MVWPLVIFQIIKPWEFFTLAINVGSSNDADSFVCPFNLEKCLSKFLIVEKSDVNLLYIDLHQFIFDYNSLNIIVDTLLSLLNDENNEFVDDGVLRQIFLEDSLMDSEYKNSAQEFYQSMIYDLDDVSDLLPSIKQEKNVDFKYVSSVMSPYYLNYFLDSNSISPFMNASRSFPTISRRQPFNTSELVQPRATSTRSL